MELTQWRQALKHTQLDVFSLARFKMVDGMTQAVLTSLGFILDKLVLLKLVGGCHHNGDVVSVQELCHARHSLTMRLILRPR